MGKGREEDRGRGRGEREGCVHVHVHLELTMLIVKSCTWIFFSVPFIKGLFYLLDLLLFTYLSYSNIYIKR